MVSYKELGLVNTREMFAKAIKGGYAIPAFNFNNMEQMQAIVQACVETSSPVIMQVSSGARKYANPTILRYMAQGAVEYAKELGKNIPIVLHLDHGDTFELCKDCVDMGFSSVMIDGSHLPYDENVALTKKVVEYAHKHDVTVEGELGVLAGVEDEVSAEHHTYTRPEDVEDFVKKTGVDSLAISIGTSHGANKFKPEQCTRNADGVLVPPELRFDILEEIEKRIPGFPIVLHGSSSVPQEYVHIINTHGGALKDAIGIPEEQLRRAADAHEQVIDGVVDDGDAEQAEQARRAERAAAPYGAQDAAVHAAADDVHRARTEAADEQINELPRAVLRQVADVLEGGEAREPREVGDVEDLRRFLPQQQMQRPVERSEREGRIKAGQQEPRPAARPVVFPQRGAEAVGRRADR